MKPKAGISWAWRSILHGRDLLKREGRWLVGNGTRINIKEDIWLANGAKVEVKENCAVKMVSELIDQGTKAWNTTELGKSISPKSAIEVMKTPMGWTNLEDDLIRSHTRDGVYSVKSGYWCLNDSINAIQNNHHHLTLTQKNLGLTYGRLGCQRELKSLAGGLNRMLLLLDTICSRREFTRDPMCPMCKEAKGTIELISSMSLDFSYMVQYPNMLCFNS